MTHDVEMMLEECLTLCTDAQQALKQVIGFAKGLHDTHPDLENNADFTEYRLQFLISDIKDAIRKWEQ